MRPLCSFLRGMIIVEKKHSVPNVIWGVFTRFSSLDGLYGLPKGGHLPIVDVRAGASGELEKHFLDVGVGPSKSAPN